MNGSYFAGRLKELRESAGLTQGELAKAAGLSQNAVSQWEQSQRKPSWENVIALAAALGVSTEAFLEKPGEAPPRGRGRPPEREGGKGRGRGNK